MNFCENRPVCPSRDSCRRFWVIRGQSEIRIGLKKICQRDYFLLTSARNKGLEVRVRTVKRRDWMPIFFLWPGNELRLQQGYRLRHGVAILNNKCRRCNCRRGFLVSSASTEKRHEGCCMSCWIMSYPMVLTGCR